MRNKLIYSLIFALLIIAARQSQNTSRLETILNRGLTTTRKNADDIKHINIFCGSIGQFQTNEIETRFEELSDFAMSSDASIAYLTDKVKKLESKK